MAGMPVINLAGKTFGRLTVISAAGPNRHGSMMWKAECACGTTVVVDGQHLRKGAVISCGCSKLAHRDTTPPPAVRGARWIALGGGGHALVDAQDADLASMAWHLHEGRAVRYEKRRMVRMHRVIAERAGIVIPTGGEVDHRDRNPLNNRRSNLRGCTRGQNAMNAPARSASGFKGVVRLATGKWMAQITAEGQHHYLGSFGTPEAAAGAYNVAARRLHGDFAVLNEVP